MAASNRVGVSDHQTSSRPAIVRHHRREEVFPSPRIHAPGWRLWAGGGGWTRAAGIWPRAAAAALRLQTESGHDRREAEHVRRDHRLQQLLRVRHRQGRSRSDTPDSFKTSAVDGEGRGPRATSRRDYHLEDFIKPAAARGAHLPHALRRGVVDGHPVGRHSAAPTSSSASSRRRRRSSSSSRRCYGPTQMPGQRSRRSTGRTSKGCGWTRRCIR